MPSRLFSQWMRVIPDLNGFKSTEEAPGKLEHHVEHVPRMMRKGRIAALKVGRTWRVRPEALGSYMMRTAKMAKHDPRRNR
jgi:excisionase family DNA binding protein